MTDYVDAGVVLNQPGQKLLDFTLKDTRHAQYGLAGLVVTGSANQCEIGRFTIGPTSDNGILLYTGSGHWIHDGTIHDSYTNGWTGWGTHGIYDKRPGTRVENVEAWNHPHGACFSVRWPNTYWRCTAHDSPTGFGVADYSDGTGGTLVIREALIYKLTRVAFQIDPDRLGTGDANLGPATFGVELDHCTLDLRGCAPDWYAAPVDLSKARKPCYVTNSVVIWDGPGPWLAAPSTGPAVDTSGTVVLTSAQAAKYLDVAYKPVLAFDSPLAGRAGQSPPKSYSLYGNLPDVGRYPAPKADTAAAVTALTLAQAQIDTALKALGAA